MKYILRFVFLAGLLLCASGANAATCFWVGGGSHVWSTTASWASASNGTGGTCAATGGYPHNAADSGTLDSNSGGGTVTFDAPISISNITMSAFTGTLTNATNNVQITLSGSLTSSGSGTRTLNCGTATWIFTNGGGSPVIFAGATNFTDTCTSAIFSFQPASITSVITISAFTSEAGLPTLDFETPSAGSQAYPYALSLTTAATIAGLTAVNSPFVTLTASTTLTITNAPSLSGSLAAPLILGASGAAGANQVTITTGAGFTCGYCGFFGIALTNAPTVPFANAWNFSRNTNVNVTAPVAGSGGHIISG